MNEPFICRTLRKEDEEAVRRLVESTFEDTRSIEKFWDWKYLRNPDFNHSYAAVAEIGGGIIGCNHWLPRHVKLSKSIVVDSMFGTSIAVTPQHRKKGVGRALIYFLRRQHGKRKPPLMCMFAYPELSERFHTPVGGYIPAPSCTVLYMKILNWSKAKTTAAAFNERVKRGEFKNQLAKVDLTIAIKASGVPTLCLRLDNRGVEIGVPVESADVTILSDLSTLSRIRNKEGRLRMLIWLLLTGKLKIRGHIRKILTMYRQMWVFREILSGQIV